MTIRLTNVGTDVATDIVIKISGGKDIVASSMASIAKIEGKKSESTILPVNIDGNLEPGTYLLNITAIYRNSSDNTYYASRLYEFKVASVAPFIPPFYIAIAIGAVVVALVGYFLYAWKPENLPEGNSPQSEKIQKSNVYHDSQDEPFKKRKPALRKVLVITYITALLILLLVPYLVHVNLDNAGLVVYSGERTVDSLPEGIQELAKLKGFVQPVILLVKHQQPERVTMVVTSEMFWPGEVVELFDYVVNWHVDWRDFNLVDQSFDRFVIASVRQLNSIESAIEYLLLPPLGEALFTLSKADFYVGSLAIVLLSTVLLQKRLALWNIPAAISFYSFQIWVLNKIAYDHGNYVTLEFSSFGYFFFVLLPVTVYMWRFERSQAGSNIARKLSTLSQAIGLSK
jgi:hypothetical protein